MHAYVSASLLCFVLLTYQRGTAVAKNKGDKLTVHVINLKERKDRWKQMRKLWSPYFSLKRVDAKKGKGGKSARCGLASTVVEFIDNAFAKDNSNLEYVMIMEDDAIPTHNFNESFVWEVIDQAISVVLPTWHVLNFAPWFTSTPNVISLNRHLVGVDYFHAM